MTEDWGGWNPHERDRRRAIAQMTPLERIEWLEQTLLMWGTERLHAERARRQAEVDALWGAVAQPDGAMAGFRPQP